MPTDLERLLAHQDYVVTRAQLRCHGVGHDEVRHHVAMRRWRAIGGSVVVLHCGPLSHRQCRWTAVLAQPSGALLGGLTAAGDLGLRRVATEPLHVVLPAGRHGRRMPGVRLHWSRTLTAADRDPRAAIPTSRLPRSLVDAARWAATDRAAVVPLLAAVQQRLATPAELRRSLHQARGFGRRAALVAVLADAEGGVHSLGELDFARRCRESGLPEPRRQALRTDGFGRTRYLDADFESFSVEVDGCQHLAAAAVWEDHLRDFGLLLRGQRRLRVPSWAVRLEWPTVAAALWEAHRVFGRPAA